MANVLLVTTLDDPADVPEGVASEGDAVKIVAPVVRQGVLGWLMNDQRAFEEAQAVARRTGRRLRGATVDARAGEDSVELAIRDALATFPAEEIVVAIRPEDEARLLERLETRRIPPRVQGVPVTTLVVGRGRGAGR